MRRSEAVDSSRSHRGTGERRQAHGQGDTVRKVGRDGDVVPGGLAKENRHSGRQTRTARVR